jgi:sortase A
MRLARVLGAVGRTLITAGVLILLFVAYQLWGTGIREAQAQNRLEDEFEEQLRDAGLDDPTIDTTTTTGASTTTSVSTTSSTTPPAPPPDGEAAARIVIPSIGVDKIVVQNVRVADLKKGPGHYPGTPMPGQEGNVAIAGHRTTYGAPFNRIDELRPGDEIEVTTLQGTFRYAVIDEEGDGNGNRIVTPTQVDVLDDKGDDRLTLTSCHPKYSARRRIVVAATLIGEAVDAPPPPVEDPGDPAVEPSPPETLDAGLDGERAGAWPAVWYALACAAVWFLAWLVGRRWRKWPSYALGAVPFLVLLFYFFENFARLLPANY